MMLVALLGAACVPFGTAVQRPAVTAASPPLTETATAASVASPIELCLEFQELHVSAGASAEQAVVTSYRCRGAHVDSTGQSPSTTPALHVEPGASLSLRFAPDQAPDEVEVRLYSSAGVAGSWMRWPEELPTGHTPVDQFVPEPGVEVRYPLYARGDVPPGAYSLVVRAAWEDEVEVWYAISFVTR
jgi:hypothetical protein